MFARAGSEATRRDLAGAAWPVYEHFDIEPYELWDEDVFIYAPFRPPPAETVGRVVGLGDLPRDRGLKRLYAPLREVPDLFLRFAGLARKGPIPRDDALAVMREWVTTYGVLGIEGVDHLEIPGRSERRSGRRESLTAFAEAVRTAARCLELYEAATARVEDRPNLGDAERRRVDAISKSLEGYGASGRTLAEKQEWAYVVAGDIVGEHVSAECYPRLYRTVEKGKDGKALSWHEQTTVSFEQGWGFDSLLGAMYLQMMLYMLRGGQGTRCKRPDCYRLVTFISPQPAGDPGFKKGARSKYRTRKDKVFCGKACAQWWSDNFGNSKKARLKRERQDRNPDAI